ncbi:hypothetical protein JCM5353_008920 [Sporobolomyces roseus]
MRFPLFALLVVGLVSPIFATDVSSAKDNIGLKLFSFKVPTIKIPTIKVPPIKIPPIKLPPVFKFPPIKLPPIIPFFGPAQTVSFRGVIRTTTLSRPTTTTARILPLYCQGGTCPKSVSNPFIPGQPLYCQGGTCPKATPSPTKAFAPNLPLYCQGGTCPGSFPRPAPEPVAPLVVKSPGVVTLPLPVGKIGTVQKISKRSISSCPDGKIACPVPGLLHGFDCVDIQSDLRQCGDCQVLGGVDCSQLPGTARVNCIKGFCHVDSCLDGYLYDFRKRSCVQAPRFGFQ